MPDIFLSYTREDQAAAQRFAKAFEAQGFSVWWDVTLRSGETYDQVTEEALRTAKAVVVLWSKKSVLSRWVRAEATLADRNRTLVPAMVEPCERPIMFELTQTADLSHWTGGANDAAWRAFVTDVRRFIEAGAAPQTSTSRTSAQASASHSARPSLAVLPFINRSGREEDDVFADGMVEDLTAALSANPRVKVVAPRATAGYRNAAVDLRQIGRDLGVRYLLEGNVRRVGDDLRVTAQLVEADSESILWTQKFDRPLAELAALQEELVGEVAAHLGGQVIRAEMEHALKKPGEVNAWEAMMRAGAYATHATRSSWEAAVAEARRATVLDPNYGEAYALLAATQGRVLLLSGGDDPELAQEIIDNVRRARQLEPNNPGVLIGIASALAALRKLNEALTFAERAVSINSTQDNSRILLGSILVRLGRSDDAIRELDAFERLGPNSSLLYYSAVWRAAAHLQAGRLIEALEAADRALRLLPGSEALIQSMLCLARLNRWGLARDAVRRLRETDPETSCARVESLVRDFYFGSSAVEEHVATVRRVWGEA
jgi:TolB-like protein/Flp pilus assembly protein TadD